MIEFYDLQQELASRSIVLSLDNESSRVRYTAPRGALTPELREALREHKDAIRASLLPVPTPAPSASTERQHRAPELQASRPDPYRPSKQELAMWRLYYQREPWYQHNQYGDSPFALALEYALGGHDGLCNAVSSNHLIWFYEQCQEDQAIEPRQYTSLLRQAYQSQDVQALVALASNFNTPQRLAEIADRARVLFGGDHQGKSQEEQSQTSTSESQSVSAPKKVASDPIGASFALIKKQLAQTVYADIQVGQAISEKGQTSTFMPGCTLMELLEAIQKEQPCKKLFLCGALPAGYEQWLMDAQIRAMYTTGKRGHFFDKEREENHVARYEQRESGVELVIRTMSSWFGDTQYTPEQARQVMQLIDKYLQVELPSDACAYATPALTFQSIWKLKNRLDKKSFESLPDEIRQLIRKSSGQGRIELCTVPGLEKISGLYYYDGIWMYSALAWGMPTELASHDNQNEYAGKVPARYRIRYTVPANWQHVGIFMTPKEQVTGNSRDRDAWVYPGSESQGKTYETWTDGAELEVAYTGLPDDMPKWDITILERIVFKPEAESTVKKPLDPITNILVKIRGKVELDAQSQLEQAVVYKLLSGAFRNILLHGIGSFNRSQRDVTYILRNDEPAPDGYIDVHPLDDDYLIFTVPQATESYTQAIEHPEWSALIWARCRARMLKAALSLPREQLVAIRTDALAVTRQQPQWESNDRRGMLRPKWSIKKQLKAPHSFEALDRIIHQYAKGDR